MDDLHSEFPVTRGRGPEVASDWEENGAPDLGPCSGIWANRTAPDASGRVRGRRDVESPEIDRASRTSAPKQAEEAATGRGSQPRRGQSSWK